VALLDALRALCSFDPPSTLPPCDMDELAEVLDVHGLAPLASYHLEQRSLGAAVPEHVRERLLPIYQGVVNDNVFKLVTLKQALGDVDVPVLLLGGAAYLDWLYPHLAFRPVGDPRFMVRGADGARFAAGISKHFKPEGSGAGGHTASFTSGQFSLTIQEGIVRGRGDDMGAFARATPFAAVAPTLARPSAEDALLVTVADLALAGLSAPLLEYVDVRELVLRIPIERADEVKARAAAAGLDRALYGALSVAEAYFPQIAAQAEALRPDLGRAERIAVDRVAEPPKDPTRLRAARGSEAAARLVVAPRG
jgi:hypothetical protein